MQFVSKVELVFAITGRGCVIVPGIPCSFSPPIGIGAELEFRNPSGSVVRTKMSGIELVNRGKLSDHIPFSISKSTTKNEIELGAELYLVSNTQKT